MLVPNRHGSSNSYRYGFQGQEKDDELKGEGNSLNYTFRMHDPRVGRFFAPDPLTHKYPYYTPYSFSGNKVIAFVELEGLEEFLPDYINKVHKAISTNSRFILAAVENAKNLTLTEVARYTSGKGGRYNYNKVKGIFGEGLAANIMSQKFVANIGGTGSAFDAEFELKIGESLKLGETNKIDFSIELDLEKTLRYSRGGSYIKQFTFMWGFNNADGTANIDQPVYSDEECKFLFEVKTNGVGSFANAEYFSAGIDQILRNTEDFKNSNFTFDDADFYYPVFVADYDAWKNAYDNGSESDRKMMNDAVERLNNAEGGLILIDGLNEGAKNEMAKVKSTTKSNN